MINDNVDSSEVEKFEALADDWWNPAGKLKTLHVINPVRLNYIATRVPLAQRRVLDVGCGGGLLSEAMATQGARVTAIDASHAAITVAQDHAEAQGLDISYAAVTAEDFAGANSKKFELVTCMELLEHVPDPQHLITTLASLLNDGGHLFIATINRNLKSYLSTIAAAEYLLRLLPVGTHDYASFIRPGECCGWLRTSGFRIEDIAGLTYIPGIDYCALSANPDVNYMVHARLVA